MGVIRFLGPLAVVIRLALAGEGIHLVNCADNSGRHSRIAYFADDSKTHYGQPTAVSNYVDNGNGYVTWEGRKVSGYFPSSGVTFTSDIWASAYDSPNYSKVGTGYNGANWSCFRDDRNILYNPPGGGTCTGIYYCLK